MKRLMTNCKGQVLVLVALFLVLVMCMAALAIDIGVAYGVRAKLYAALDAAAIAAGRVIGQGEDAARKEAERFFRANFTEGMMGAKAGDLQVFPDNKADGSWTITVTSSATVPTRFARIVGWPTFTVKSSVESTVRTMDMMLVLDTSTSLQRGRNPLDPNAFEKLKAAAQKFVGNFDSRNDRIGLIHFASGVVVDVPISDTKGFDVAHLKRLIAGLEPIGETTSGDAIRKAKEQLDAINSSVRSDIRAIVFFSDGSPNTITGTFAIPGGLSITGSLYSEVFHDYVCNPPCEMFELNQQDTKLGPGSAGMPGKYTIATLPARDCTGLINLSSDFRLRPLLTYDNTICNVNRAARNMAENIANAARDEKDKPIHIFTIGLGDGLTNQQFEFADECGYDNSELGANLMKRLANVPDSDTYNPQQPSGIYAYAAKSSQLDAAFAQVVSFILRLSK